MSESTYPAGSQESARPLSAEPEELTIATQPLLGSSPQVMAKGAAAAAGLNQQLTAQSAEQELVLDLQQYPIRTRRTLTLLWLFTGVFGGHRYYLNQVSTGVLMTLTYGMAGGLWIADGFRLKKMLAAYNGEQQFRQKRGLPPMELDFLPTLDTRILERRPAWFLAGKMRSTLRWDLAVVGVVGFLLGVVSVDDGWKDFNPEAIIALLALLALINLHGQLLALRRYRVVQESLQWYLKLKLYYHQNAIPKPRVLLLRPLVGLFTVLFRRRRAGEARLYMELGIVFSFVFGLYSVVTGDFFSSIGQGDLSAVLREWLGGTVTAFFLTYLCLTPIGATLLKYDLLEKGQFQLRLVSLTALAGVCLGLIAEGF